MSQAEEIRATLAYLRRNRAQSELAESFGVSQASICRTIARWTPRIAEVLADLVPTADDLDQTQTLIVDGTLVPCWDWKNQPGLYSGKHHRTGLNLQVACTLTGRLVWVSDPAPGSTHDAKALQRTGFLDIFPDMPPLGDKGYTGLGMTTRYANHQAAGSRTGRNNTTTPSIRYVHPVERAISHLKTWRILHAGYRRPLDTFPQTITAVIALEFFKNSFE